MGVQLFSPLTPPGQLAPILPTIEMAPQPLEFDGGMGASDAEKKPKPKKPKARKKAKGKKKAATATSSGKPASKVKPVRKKLPFGANVWEERVYKGLAMMLIGWFGAPIITGLVYLFSVPLAVPAAAVILTYVGIMALPALFVYGAIILTLGLLALRRDRKRREKGESNPEGERTY
jgi:hypothetical protein